VKEVGCLSLGPGAASARPSASSMTSPEHHSDNISPASDPDDLVESAISDLEVSIAGPYAGSRPNVTPAIGTAISEIYSGSLRGLEPGSLAASWLVETWFNGQVQKSWPVYILSVSSIDC
jgi:hypothetical protein